jgi:DNA end-binding protein Ku
MLRDKKAEIPEKSGTMRPSPQNVINLMDALKRSLAVERPNDQVIKPSPRRTAGASKRSSSKQSPAQRRKAG